MSGMGIGEPEVEHSQLQLESMQIFDWTKWFSSDIARDIMPIGI
jgi:hypothetical protein